MLTFFLARPSTNQVRHINAIFRVGKHTCIEKDIEIIPLQKTVTVLPKGTGISKILSDYTVETTFEMVGRRSTKGGN
jgi:hypothetical protein